MLRYFMIISLCFLSACCSSSVLSTSRVFSSAIVCFLLKGFSFANFDGCELIVALASAKVNKCYCVSSDLALPWLSILLENYLLDRSQQA